MSDSLSLIEIFGGGGAILLGIGGCLWKCYQGYEFNYEWGFFSKNIPTHTLDTNWESNGNPDSIEDFGESYNRRIFAKEIGRYSTDKKWKIKMKKGDGNVFLYKNIYMKPTDNDGHHFLRVTLRNLPANAKIKLSVKCFTQKWTYLPNHPEYSEEVIPNCCTNTYTIKRNSLLDDPEIVTEQIGIYFDASEVDYNCVMEEAYYGKECNIINFQLFDYPIISIFYHKKPAGND